MTCAERDVKNFESLLIKEVFLHEVREKEETLAEVLLITTDA
jgi:hypothetical protein